MLQCAAVYVHDVDLRDAVCVVVCAAVCGAVCVAVCCSVCCSVLQNMCMM